MYYCSIQNSFSALQEMLEFKKAHGSSADVGHQVLLYLRGRDELQHRGWALRVKKH